MSPAEIGWRAVQTLRNRMESRVGVVSAVPAPNGGCGRAWLDLWPGHFDSAAYRVAADRVLNGHWDVLGMKDAALGFPPDWNRDPKTGTCAPLRFGKSIDYRNKSLVGEIKYLWEPNRHLELVTLAQAWRISGDRRYADAARVLLESWFEQCPYPLGPNWSSALELAVRLVNWSVAWHLLGAEDSPLFEGEAGQSFRRRWLDAVFRHGHFIGGHLSRHSSANNHLFGELMGVFVAGVTWPMWPEAARWRESAQRELEEQALLQNASDGVNREQAFYYHHEVADMMLLVWRYGEANGVSFSTAFRDRLEAMLEFIASVMDVAGHVPMVGDADDAVMVRFSQKPDFCPYHSLLASGAVLFSRADFARKACAFDDKSRWLLGDAAEQRFEALLQQDAKHPLRREFPEGGYFVLGSGLDTPQEIRLVADAGPLGYLGIAAHGHADALAFTLSLGGHEFLVDPGTYTYQGDSPWRQYFRGTAAHNTVRIDGLDQSVSGGTFMWIDKARVRNVAFRTGDDEDVMIAEHDGYLRLKQPLLHRREIRLHKREARLTVTDDLLGEGSHEAEWFWHFAEAIQVRLEGDRVIATDAGRQLEMRFSGFQPEITILNGQTDPMAGWISRAYQQKCATSTVVCRGSVEGATRCVTEFVIHGISPGASHG
jgi:hypothetical protein